MTYYEEIGMLRRSLHVDFEVVGGGRSFSRSDDQRPRVRAPPPATLLCEGLVRDRASAVPLDVVVRCSAPPSRVRDESSLGDSHRRYSTTLFSAGKGPFV